MIRKILREALALLIGAGLLGSVIGLAVFAVAIVEGEQWAYNALGIVSAAIIGLIGWSIGDTVLHSWERKRK